MADTKISALTAASTPLAGTEVLPIVQSSTTVKVSVANLTAGRSVSAASLSLTTTPLAVTSGGTGLATVAQGDLLYGSASNTLSALAKNTTATRYLANTGTSNNPAWAQVNLTNGVTGTLPVANGGTGLTSLTANQVLYGSFSQSGNLVFDGTNLGIGTTPGGSYKLEISGTGKFGVSSDAVVYWGAAFTGNNRGFLTWDTNSAIVGGPQNLDFSTGGSNRVRVHTSGGFSIGNTTDPGATNLSVTGQVSTTNAITGIRNNITSTDRISVTGATTIFSIATSGSSVGASGAVILVNGYNTASNTNSFIDLVLFIGSNTPTVLGSVNRGSPAARTYTASGSNLQLAMASGTYNVSSSSTEQAC